MNRCSLVLASVFTFALVGVAAAQQVEIKAAPPPRAEEIDGIINPGLQYEITRPDDFQFVPQTPRVHYDPAFVEPLSVPTETGRMGIAGWTAPSAAMGGTQSGAREIAGHFAIGFAIEWGGPPPATRARAR
jgi:hypothetical protein